MWKDKHPYAQVHFEFDWSGGLKLVLSIYGREKKLNLSLSVQATRYVFTLGFNSQVFGFMIISLIGLTIKSYGHFLVKYSSYFTEAHEHIMITCNPSEQKSF